MFSVLGLELGTHSLEFWFKMKLSEIKLTLNNHPKDQVKAFVKVTTECGFTIRDIRVIEVDNRLIIGMPSRRVTGNCSSPRCFNRPSLGDSYCARCGSKQDRSRPEFRDIVFPSSRESREEMERLILQEFERKKLDE